ncbi:helix-turn-helix domain-containing protein [Cesiribacter sp. SM1]|uniref:AraC family transcriptional regulator n=1 Tax=Cesiribacter sp. SM1 TaxID=2861196 RepID=UPI001CD40776|nr:helix-turn-helix domain-containing protein [Cesiribacter sp. SM1]
MATVYYTIPPPAHLAPYIRFFWVLESDHRSYLHQAMADVCPELVFHYRGQFDEIKANGVRVKSSVAGLQGQTSNTSRFHINQRFGIFGTYLYPYTLTLLFGIPATEIVDQYTDLCGILGAEGKQLEEKIMEAAHNTDRVNILSRFLEHRLKGHSGKAAASAICSSVHLIMQEGGSLRVDALAQEACLSQRQYERKFRQLTGFSPKLFSRIVRFHSAFNAYKQPSGGGDAAGHTLTQLALEKGYYDQSHFIQDFKQFSGLNPGRFFSGKAEGLDWLRG